MDWDLRDDDSKTGSQGDSSITEKARDARLNDHPDFRDILQKATRSARSDRNDYWTEITGTMETAANCVDFSKLFRLIRTASGKRQSTKPLFRNAAGLLIPEQGKKMQRWTEPFDYLLNRPVASSAYRIPAIQSEGYDVYNNPPKRDEITDVTHKLKNRKSLAEDGIAPEIYKSYLSISLEPLHTLFSSIWEKEQFPADWGTSVLLPLPKKGNRPCAKTTVISV